MSAETSDANQSALLPHEIDMIAGVVGRIISESRFSDDPNQQEKFAAYVLGMYNRGMRNEENLYRLCLAAAKERFSKPGAA